jgi:2-polyprenyl-3-methyl-5-hydroxy-6-metoxy-1,4-benzoquinol methylase
MESKNTVFDETGQLFDEIWRGFRHEDYQRHQVEGLKRSPIPIPLEWYKDKVCLDGGCGGGRYLRYMASAGAREVHGIDAGNTKFARETTKDYGDRVVIKNASVLDIPYEDETFDFVHCAGVLHHTANPRKGFSELVRVLKKDGVVIISVYGRQDIFRRIILALAHFLSHILPLSFAFKILKLIYSDPEKIYNIAETIYVPVRTTHRQQEIIDWFEEEGLSEIKRLKTAWEPYSYLGGLIKGEGFLKFMAEKA